MKKMLAMLAALVMMAVAAPANADHTTAEDYEEGDGVCTSDTIYYPATAESESSQVYIAIDEVASNDYIFSIWVYGESNNEAGIQRHDSYCFHEGYDDDNRDTVIF